MHKCMHARKKQHFAQAGEAMLVGMIKAIAQCRSEMSPRNSFTNPGGRGRCTGPLSHAADSRKSRPTGVTEGWPSGQQ